MKIIVLLATCAATASLSAAEWENLSVNSLNRLPPRTYSMPLADEAAALTDEIEPATPYKKSLNGMWKISWVGNPDLREKDFHRAEFDDSDWFEIDVPSCVEMRGFGNPGYTNQKYPHAWDPKRDIAAPTIRDRDTDKSDYNPVSSYRTRFTVPELWRGRDVILRFDGVYSAYYVWVNGHKVGYAEDSKLPSEFDITRFLRNGENVLAVEVYRWCDGSFLEDQDMFRFSGIFRDVTLWAKPKNGIWDFTVKTMLKNDYKDATLTLEGLDGDWSAMLYDANKNLVLSLSALSNTSSVSDVHLWSAETPYLYTLVIRRGNDMRMKRVGFKEQKIVGNKVLVNGKPIKFKGVNRHETNPENGRTVSIEDMVKDVRLMKRFNIDTVRTSHYPNHRLWYDLCDRYGIYVVAEANVEGHEPQYAENGLGRFPEWSHAIIERNERQVVFYRNNPSVTIWSVGNETGHGECFRQAIATVRRTDSTRFIHWERGNADADIDSSMYPSVDWLEKRGKLGDSTTGTIESVDGGEGFAISGHRAGKPYFMCEYAHAMGNAIGNLDEYWQVVYAHPALAGGCIWDWVDQAIWKRTGKVDPRTGEQERYLAYGGDWDETPHDGPFCCNGIIDPLRTVSAKLVEVGHVYRNLVVTRKGSTFELWNRFGFTFADAFAGRWELIEDGVRVKSGTLIVPHLGPQARGLLAVPELDGFLFNPAKEYFVNFTFSLKADALWAGKGWVVASDQIPLCGSFKGLETTKRMMPTITDDGCSVTIKAGVTKAVFSRKTGTLSELLMNNKVILKDPVEGVVAGPRFGCLRAFVDNDRWLRDGNPWVAKCKFGMAASGLTQPSWHARPIIIRDGAVYTVVEMTGSKSAGFSHESTWTFGADGSLDVANVVTFHGTMPTALPRMGLAWKLDSTLENIYYYGRGPRENYIDRKTGSFLGVWRSTVTEQYEDYVRPQDNGYKCDVRWVAFADTTGRGVRFSASEPMFVQALHYDADDLEFAHHRAKMARYRKPLEPVPEVRVNLDVRQLGLGGNSCGPWPMEKYVFPVETTRWTLRIEPFIASSQRLDTTE